MGTVVLFITLVVALSIFAGTARWLPAWAAWQRGPAPAPQPQTPAPLCAPAWPPPVFFVCYRANQQERQQAASSAAQAEAVRHAAVIFSVPPALLASPASQNEQQQQPRERQRQQRWLPAKTPTPPSIVRNLPCFTWEPLPGAGKEGQELGSGGSGEDRMHTCSVCFCDFEAGERIMMLPCLHLYHSPCISAWLERSHTCPICQADVIRAARLSAGDWSAHTLASVNYVSGANHHHVGQPAAAEAGAAANGTAAEAAPGPAAGAAGAVAAASALQTRRDGSTHSAASSDALPPAPGTPSRRADAAAPLHGALAAGAVACAPAAAEGAGADAAHVVVTIAGAS